MGAGRAEPKQLEHLLQQQQREEEEEEERAQQARRNWNACLHDTQLLVWEPQLTEWQIA